MDLSVFRNPPERIGVLHTDLPLWGYHAQTLAGTGAAGLKVWIFPHDGGGTGAVGYLAMVTELGLGASVTNAAEDIMAALRAELGTDVIVLLENYPTDQDPAEGGHIDQVGIDASGRPHWRRMWPGSADPGCDAWARRHLATLLPR